MKKRNLLQKSLTEFIICVMVLLLLATPLFYLLTKNFYAEDMIDIIENVRQGKPIPTTSDIEEDIIQGIALQFLLIGLVLELAIVLMLHSISKRAWQPFNKTLQAIETFKLEIDTIPELSDSDIKEFARLNTVLEKLMTENLHSYRLRKEITENASHEFQTPLAVFQSKLDLLLQQTDITEEQAAVIQDLYEMSGRLARLNRNLLLIAKMENKQFDKEELDLVSVLYKALPYFEMILEGVTLEKDFQTDCLPVKANCSLLESMINNLVVNGVYHNRQGGTITITLTEHSLTVSNTSDGEALDGNRIFNRFYRSSKETKGYGLGLAIVKAVCEYHGWNIAYTYHDGHHHFTVTFP